MATWIPMADERRRPVTRTSSRMSVLLVSFAVLLSGCNKQHTGGEPPAAEKGATSQGESALAFGGANSEGVELTADARRERQQERMAAAQAKFDADPVDSAWAGEVARLIEDQAATRMPITADFQRQPVQCRGTQCRLEVRYRGSAANSESALQISYRLRSSGHPSTLSFVTVPDESGDWTTGSYFFFFKRSDK